MTPTKSRFGGGEKTGGGHPPQTFPAQYHPSGKDGILSCLGGPSNSFCSQATAGGFSPRLSTPAAYSETRHLHGKLSDITNVALLLLMEPPPGSPGHNGVGAGYKRASRKGAPRKFPCDHPGCDKLYSRAEHLQRHQLNRKDSPFPKIKLHVVRLTGRLQIIPKRCFGATLATAIRSLCASICCRATRSVTQQRTHRATASQASTQWATDRQRRLITRVTPLLASHSHIPRYTTIMDRTADRTTRPSY